MIDMGDFTKCNTRYGEMLIPSSDDLIPSVLLQYGEWSELELQFIAENVVDGWNVLDIGAFIGTFGIRLSQLRRINKIYFIEANSALIPALTANVELNCNSNAVVLNKLIAANTSHGQIGYHEPGNLGSLSFKSQPQENSCCVQLAAGTMTLADATYNNSIDFIKMDVEGMEYEILKRFSPHLTDSNITFWLECNEGAQIMDALDLLLQNNYKMFYFAYPSHNPDNFSKNTRPKFPMAYEAGLFASRRSPSMPDSLREAGCIGTVITSRQQLGEALFRTPRWIPERWHHLAPPEIIAVALHELLDASAVAAKLKAVTMEKEALNEQLVHARRKPILNLRRHWRWRTSRFILRLEPLLTASFAARMRRRMMKNAHNAPLCSVPEKDPHNTLRSDSPAPYLIEANRPSLVREVPNWFVPRLLKVLARQSWLFSGRRLYKFRKSANKRAAALNRCGSRFVQRVHARRKSFLDLRRHWRWRTSRFILRLEPLLTASFAARMRRRMIKNAHNAPPCPHYTPRSTSSNPYLIEANRPKLVRDVPNWLVYRLLKVLARQSWLFSGRRLYKFRKSANKRAAVLNRRGSRLVQCVCAPNNSMSSEETAIPAPAEPALVLPLQEKVERHPIGFRAEVLCNLQPLDRKIADWTNRPPKPHPVSRSDFLTALRGRSSPIEWNGRSGA